MGTRILAGVVGVLALLGGGLRMLGNSAEHAAPYGEDLAKAGRAAAEHRPRPIRVPLPHSGGGLSEAREAVDRWTGELSLDDAKDVIGVACKLSEAYVNQAQVQQWTAANPYSYSEDKLRAFQGLVKEMRENPGVKVACKAAG